MDPAAAAKGVLLRTLGEHSDSFDLRPLSSEDDEDLFEVDAADGRVAVRGRSASALCHGAYHYLRHACHRQLSWPPRDISLPDTLPDWELQRVSSPFRCRYYLSVCTFGYSTAWWDWERWEREIDWMALHGINMPLSLVGQEKVWHAVFGELGFAAEEIQGFFSGPAYLPWHRLGNLDGHLGPLPQFWIEGQAELQKLILARQIELGMMPVVPGFSGFVPAGFRRLYPEVSLKSARAWCGFEPTYFVDPREPMFGRIADRFLRLYREEFGSAHHFLCETFAEQYPEFAPGSELEDLRELGSATWDSLVSFDSDARWVMQGWPFYYAKDYWTAERTEALLHDVPKDRLIILDLAANEHPIWKEQPAVREKGWMYCTLHNYGGATHLHGDLRRYAGDFLTAVGHSGRGNLLGAGITPEGIDQNPVVYELMTDLMWAARVEEADGAFLDADAWIAEYALSRYSAAPEPAIGAWRLLLESVYGQPGPPMLRQTWRFRPGDQPPVAGFDIGKVEEAVRLLHSASSELGDNPLYRRDLVDVAKTWLGGVADLHLETALSRPRLVEPVRKQSFLNCLRDIDRLLATTAELRLSTWLNDARSWGSNDPEKDLMERNARSLITFWGGPYLFDYAIREWAGLTLDFVLERWKLYFAAIENGLSLPEFGAWERAWAASVEPPLECEPGDEIELVSEFLSRYSCRSFGCRQEVKCVSLGKPVRSSSCEPGFEPEWVADGAMLGAFWMARPAPQWVEIDLERVLAVCGVWLFPFYGDGRSTRYKVDLSLDKLSWLAAVDGSNNDVLTTAHGHRHSFEPAAARFVRVTVLGNSVDDCVQVYEVYVFAC